MSANHTPKAVPWGEPDSFPRWLGIPVIVSHSASYKSEATPDFAAHLGQSSWSCAPRSTQLPGPSLQALTAFRHHDERRGQIQEVLRWAEWAAPL